MATDTHDEAPIVADTTDADSTLSAPITQGLSSLRSSVLQWQEENGRTYHAMSSGKYAFPNDDSEMERLDLQHNLWLLTLKGKLCLCPKETSAKRVLDAGTGTGIWAIEYADMNPSAEVIGVDLSPIQPSLVPPNCTFEADDLEKEWTWAAPFDFVFGRVLAGSLTDYGEFVRKAFDNLEPGGWFEAQEISFPYKCDDGTLPEDSDLYNVSVLFKEAAAKAGRPMLEPEQVVDHMRQQGFVNVTRRSFKWPLNDWPRDAHYKELGSWYSMNADSGLEGLTLALFTRFLGWTKEETMLYCSRVRKQLRDRRLHAYSPVDVIYGQKPETSTAEAAAS